MALVTWGRMSTLAKEVAEPTALSTTGTSRFSTFTVTTLTTGEGAAPGAAGVPGAGAAAVVFAAGAGVDAAGVAVGLLSVGDWGEQATKPTVSRAPQTVMPEIRAGQ